MSKILVADDSAMMLRIAKATLEGAGHNVVTAEDGAEAFKKAQTEKPNLVLLDAEMPEMDGWEAAEAISKDAATSSIPILLCTGHDLSGEEDHLKEAGIKGYVVKPYQAAQLIEAVKKYLAG